MYAEPDNFGHTELMYACIHDDQNEIRRILQHSEYDINVCNCIGNTVLHICAIYGRQQCAELILDDYRCDKSITNEDGQTAESFARVRGYMDLADFIRDHEITIDHYHQ